MEYYELNMRFPEFKSRAVTLSMDDGWKFDRQMIEVLDRYEIKCTFNLNAGSIEEEKTADYIWHGGRIPYEEIAEAYKNHEIASHTYTHPQLAFLDMPGVAYQIIKDREVLEEKTGRIVEGLAYPFGLSESKGMIDCIEKCGIRYGRTTVSTRNFNIPFDYLRWHPTCHMFDSKFDELVEKFFSSDDIKRPEKTKAKLFFIWGHSYEYENKWDSLEQMCEKIGNRENVWYATNMEIIDYISAYRTLRRSVNGKIIYNPTNIDVFVAVGKENVLIKKGETVVLK